MFADELLTGIVS